MLGISTLTCNTTDIDYAGIYRFGSYADLTRRGSTSVLSRPNF
jgi:hypothetical protein